MRLYLSILLPSFTIYAHLIRIPLYWFQLTILTFHGYPFWIYFSVLIWSQYPISTGGTDTFDDIYCYYCSIVIIKAYQWGWDYVYLNSNFTLSLIVHSFDISTDYCLKSYNNTLHLPISWLKLIRASSTDVAHCFAIPRLDMKTDCLPGKINDILFKGRWFGLYFGNCYEFCGNHHAFMAISLYLV